MRKMIAVFVMLCLPMIVKADPAADLATLSAAQKADAQLNGSNIALSQYWAIQRSQLQGRLANLQQRRNPVPDPADITAIQGFLASFDNNFSDMQNQSAISVTSNALVNGDVVLCGNDLFRNDLPGFVADLADGWIELGISGEAQTAFANDVAAVSIVAGKASTILSRYDGR